MYIDVSKFQGVIDWSKVAKNDEKITGVILRSTTKDGGLDYQLKANYNGVLKNMSDVKELSVYKFSYACGRGDTKAIFAYLKERNIKVNGFKLFAARLKSRIKRLIKNIYHKIR